MQSEVFVLLSLVVSFILRLSINENLIPELKIDYSKKFVLNASSLPKSNCQMCNFSVFVDSNNPPNSNEKDLILTVSFNKLQNLYCFARTARTTGYKGRIVVFTNDNAIKNKPEYYFKNIENCGVQVINVGNYVPLNPKGLYFYRYMLYSTFINDNIENLNRVLICDLYDTFFQKDPFTVNFTQDKVIFSGEGYSVNSFNRYASKQCAKVLRKIDPYLKIPRRRLKQAIFNGACVNGGLIAGGALHIAKFVRYMTRIGSPVTNEAYADDQGCLNIFVKGGVFDNMFDYYIDNTTVGFLASWATFARQRPDPFMNQTMGSFIRYGEIPAVVHQFDRSSELVNKLIRSCHVYGKPMNDYPVFKFSRTDELPK